MTKVATFCGSSPSTYNTGLGDLEPQENLLWRRGRSNSTEEAECTASAKGSFEIISAHVIPQTKARFRGWRFAFFIFSKASRQYIALIRALLYRSLRWSTDQTHLFVRSHTPTTRLFARTAQLVKPRTAWTRFHPEKIAH